MTLITRISSSRRWRTLKTAPMPPSAILPMTSYLPSNSVWGSVLMGWGGATAVAAESSADVEGHGHRAHLDAVAHREQPLFAGRELPAVDAGSVGLREVLDRERSGLVPQARLQRGDRPRADPNGRGPLRQAAPDGDLGRPGSVLIAAQPDVSSRAVPGHDEVRARRLLVGLNGSL